MRLRLIQTESAIIVESGNCKFENGLFLKVAMTEMPTPKVQNAGNFCGAKTFIVLTIIKSVHITSHHMSCVVYLHSPNN